MVQVNNKYGIIPADGIETGLSPIIKYIAKIGLKVYDIFEFVESGEA